MMITTTNGPLSRFWSRLWALLPDHCEIEGCPRTGVRGNENRYRGMIVCDDCHARGAHGHQLKVRRNYVAPRLRRK